MQCEMQQLMSYALIVDYCMMDMMIINMLLGSLK